MDRTFGIPSYERALTRKQDLTDNLEVIVQYALENRPDFFLVCGDVFDRVLPTNSPRVLLTGKIRELKESGIEVFMIGGNHDVPKVSYYTHLAIDTLGYAGLATVFSASDKLQSRIVTVGGQDVCISGKSYDSLNETSNPLRDENVPVEGKYNILMLHAAFQGLGVTSPYPSFINQNPVTPKSIPGKLDYLALGHFHNFFDRETRGIKICNPGSIERLTWLEEHDEKVFIWTELSGKEVVVESIPLKTRPMETVEFQVSKDSGNITGLLSDFFEKKGDPEKIVRLMMRGEISREQNRQLDIREIYRESRSHFFHFTLDRTELEVEGYGKIFMRRIEGPVEAYSKRLEEQMSRTKDEEEQTFLGEVKELGRKYLEENT